MARRSTLCAALAATLGVLFIAGEALAGLTSAGCGPAGCPDGVDPGPGIAPHARMTAHVTYSDFPYPQHFSATRVIGLYDSNGNGFIDGFGGASDQLFPFQKGPNGGATIGSRIGSPFVAGSSVPLQFCGDLLAYGEMPGYLGDVYDGSNGLTYFMWYAFQDPARADARGFNCGSWEVDFGFGVYDTGNPTSATIVFHATGVFGEFTSNGVFTGTGHGGAGWSMLPGGGTMANPWSLLSWDGSLNSIPSTLPEFIAGQPAGDPMQNAFIRVQNVVFDVPFVAEEHWPAPDLFHTRASVGTPIIARSISAFSMVDGENFADWSTPIRTPSALRLDFQYSRQGDSSTRYLWLRNDGDGELPLGQLSLAGSDRRSFAISYDSCSNQTLAGGSYCWVGIRFTATPKLNSWYLYSPSYNASLEVPGLEPALGPDRIALGARGKPAPLLSNPTAYGTRTNTLILK